MEKQLQVLVELYAKKTELLGLEKQYNEKVELVKLMETKMNVMNETLAEEVEFVANLIDEVMSLKAKIDCMNVEKNELPVTKKDFSLLMDECEYFYID